MFLKILKITAAVLAATCMSVSAAEWKFNGFDGVGEEAAALIYNKDGKLEKVEMCKVKITDGICTADIAETEDKQVMLFFSSAKKMIKDFLPKEEKNNADEDNKQEETNTKKSAYPTGLDEATAFMMVKEVNVTSVNDEIKTKMTVLFRGEECEIIADEDMTLFAASDANSALEGEPLSVLKPGDIIYCSSNLSGKLRTAELVYRPTSADIVTDTADYGNNFEKLYAIGSKVTKASPSAVGVFGGNNSADRTYMFGLIRETGASYMTLCNKSGFAAKNTDIDITEDTIVYVYDKTKKNGDVHIGDISDIAASGFGSDAEDADGNIVDWSKDFEHNYALVRMTDGTAMEIALYLNY